MDVLLIIALIAFAAGMALSGRRPTREPQLIYIIAEPEQRSGGGLLLLIFIAIVLIIMLFAQ